MVMPPPVKISTTLNIVIQPSALRPVPTASQDTHVWTEEGPYVGQGITLMEMWVRSSFFTITTKAFEMSQTIPCSASTVVQNVKINVAYDWLLYCLRQNQIMFKVWHHLSFVTRKPVFEVCDQATLKPACSADETS